MLCFEVRINNEGTCVAGGEHIAVLTLIATHVASESETELRVGGLVHRPNSDEQIERVQRSLKSGDEVVIRVVDTDNPSQPISRQVTDSDFVNKQKRKYYEQLN